MLLSLAQLFLTKLTDSKALSFLSGMYTSITGISYVYVTYSAAYLLYVYCCISYILFSTYIQMTQLHVLK